MSGGEGGGMIHRAEGGPGVAEIQGGRGLKRKQREG